MLLKILESNISHNLKIGQSIKKLTTLIAHILVDRNISFYVHIFKQIIYHKIRYIANIIKVDWKDCFERLGKLGNK